MAPTCLCKEFFSFAVAKVGKVFETTNYFFEKCQRNATLIESFMKNEGI